MRFFWISDTFTELSEWPQTLTGPGFLWVTSGRREFEVLQSDIQAQLHRLAGGALVDLHISDSRKVGRKMRWADIGTVFKYRKLWGVYIGQFAVT